MVLCLTAGAVQDGEGAGHGENMSKRERTTTDDNCERRAARRSCD